MTETTTNDFYVVGIGSSAGGLDPLETFFSSMPPNEDIGFVVIQHLSPDYKSHMVELLSKHTSMPVHQATDGMRVEPNHIYLLPRRKNMTIFKGKLYLIDYTRTQGLNLPIDIFFESLAEDRGEKAIGIILSGTGSDGTRGVRAIKEAGGMVMAQDGSAKFDGMPQSAIATRLVDYILPPEDMPVNLLNYIKHPCLITDPTLRLDIANDDDTMGKLFAILQRNTEVDFTGYKPNTVIRRIERRMSINQVEELADYVQFLQKSPIECRSLYKEFLIGVTRFFRDPEAFEFLSNHVIPELFAGRTTRDQIRVWVPGCATGEEAYSLAILFHEHMRKVDKFVDVKIFATDLDKESLEFASQGIYPDSIIADVSLERLQEFFVKKGGTHEILRPIRSMVVFAHQNLVKDPPFSKMDLISCRNLLIYLQPALQKKVLSTFQFSLKPNGYVFLGSSESVGEYASVFHVKNNKWKIYQYQGSRSAALNYARMREGTLSESENTVRVSGYRKELVVDDWRSSDGVLRSLVEQVMPPCVVVDENQMVIHAFGNVRRFLEAPIGYRVSLSLSNMVREELTLPLNTALHRTVKEEEEVTYRNIILKDEDQTTQIHLTTRPFWEQSTRQRLYLIIFSSVENEVLPEHATTFSLSQSATQRISDLERELQYTRESLQATIEELETANEELQATNEELLAANEELQSTNEELQSVNEELLTVNAEYQAKIRELTALNDDINNLLSNIDVGTVFLDAQMNLRKFTHAVQKDVNVLEQDIGRPLAHITHNFESVDLSSVAQAVLDTLTSSEREIVSKSGTWYQLKANPYRTHANRIDGVVLNLVDISNLKQLELHLEDLNLVRKYFDIMPSLVVVLNRDGEITYINQTGCQLLGYAANELIGKNWFTTCLPEDERTQLHAAFNQIVNGELASFRYHENRIITRDEQERLMAWHNELFNDKSHQVFKVLSFGIDITERHRQANQIPENSHP